MEAGEARGGGSSVRGGLNISKFFFEMMRVTTAWIDDPNVLTRAPFDLIPRPEFSLNRSANAVMRSVLIVALIVVAYARAQARALILVVATVAGLGFLFHVYRAAQEDAARGAEDGRAEYAEHRGDAEQRAAAIRAEGFELVSAKQHARESARDHDLQRRVRRALAEQRYQAPRTNNPYGNLTVADAAQRPDRLPAPPLNTAEMRHRVQSAMKKQIESRNPGIADRLFATSEDQFQLQQSLLPFYTLPCTTAVNDAVAAWKFMVPNTAAMRDGITKRGTRQRPRF